jgi:hypothetical protein
MHPSSTPLNSPATRFFPTCPGAFPSALRTAPNTYYFPFIKISYTLNLYPTGPVPDSALPTCPPTHSFANSDTTSKCKSWTTKLLRPFYPTSTLRTFSTLVPPVQKRTNTAERAIQTFRRHFLSLIATTHPSFPINHWPALLPQAEVTVNLLHAYSDLHSISAYNGIYREPYDFLSHPIAPCGTLIVLHNTRRETWDNFGLIGFYLGPSLNHYGLTAVLSPRLTPIACLTTLSLRSIARPH